MRPRDLAARAALAFTITSDVVWAYPTEIYRATDPSTGASYVLCCCGGLAIPAILYVAALQWNNPRVRWGLIVAVLAYASVVIATWRPAEERVVRVVSAHQLRVDVEPIGRPPRVGRQRFDIAEVTCVVRHVDSCDNDNNCEEYFVAELKRGGREFVPTERAHHTSAASARARCDALEVYGIRPG